MFGLARQIVQHKVGVVAVIAFAVVMFSKDGDGAQQQKKAYNAWSSQSAQVASMAQGEDDSVVGQVVGKVTQVASDCVGEQTGVDPAELKEQTVDSFSNTADAYKKANHH